MNYIYEPLGQLLYYIYSNFAFHSYGVALIIFTIIIKLILLPLTIKQFSSTQKMQELQPQIQEIQKRYKDDKTKLNAEMIKLYQEKGFNPAGGCLPTLVQMPILFGLFFVISRPITSILHMGENIPELAKALDIPVNAGYVEIKVLNSITNNIATSVLHNDGLVSKLMDLKGSLNFMGINLGHIPSYHTSDLFGSNWHIYLPLLVVPVLAALFTYLSTKMMTTPNMLQNDDNNPMKKSMMYMAPLITLVMGFQFPAGLGLYWIVGSVFQIIQTKFVNKFIFNKKKEVLVN